MVVVEVLVVVAMPAADTLRMEKMPRICEPPNFLQEYLLLMCQALFISQYDEPFFP